MRQIILFLASLLIIISGCMDSPRVKHTPTPEATAALPTLAMLPTRTPTPTSTVTPVPPTATRTPYPTPLPFPTMTFTPTLPPAPESEAQVAEGRGGLRLRQLPDSNSNVLLNLRAATPLNILGKSLDNQWVKVEIPEGFTGWVWSAFLDIYVDLASVPAIENPDPEPLIPGREPPPEAQVVSSNISGVTGTARQIYVRGQARGNRPNVFSKVGDSLTITSHFLHPYGWGTYNLREYGYLLPVVQYFLGAVARETNTSYQNISFAAEGGWSTATVLNPDAANEWFCEAGETPLACEYRIVKPSVALIMFGTNDVAGLTAQQYEANLRRVVQITIDSGIIPVLYTFPNHIGFEGKVSQFNQIVIRTARSFDIPLIDYGGAIATLPGQGLSEDGAHPNSPPGGASATADFTEDNLKYGYTLRNLLTLQALDAVWRNAMY